MQATRKVVRDVLATHFAANEAKQMEAKIFNMCNELRGNNVAVNVYSEYAYEKVGELIRYPEMKTQILNDIIALNTGWNSCVYAKFRENERKDTSDQVTGMKVSKGVFKCKDNTCKSDECYYYTMQTSSCDESMTTYVVCSKCGNRYTVK